MRRDSASESYDECVEVVIGQTAAAIGASMPVCTLEPLLFSGSALIALDPLGSFMAK